MTVITITPRSCGWPDELLPEAEGLGQQFIGSPTAPRGDSFDCYKGRYEIVVYYHPSELWMTRWTCCPRPSAFGLGQQFIGSSTAPRGDSFDCYTGRYEIVVYYTYTSFVKKWCHKATQYILKTNNCFSGSSGHNHGEMNLISYAFVQIPVCMFVNVYAYEKNCT